MSRCRKGRRPNHSRSRLDIVRSKLPEPRLRWECFPGAVPFYAGLPDETSLRQNEQLNSLHEAEKKQLRFIAYLLAAALWSRPSRLT
jgi:hypothetical protein